ncbi:MAG: DNA polymerase III subunit beta, partial [candidate division WOR-3 bacterium]
MRCEIDRVLLNETLSNILTVLPSRTPSPDATVDVKLVVKEHRLLLLATDGETFLEIRLPLEQAAEDGIAIVNARKLAELVNALETESVSFYTEGNNLRMDTRKTRTVLLCAAPADFPQLKELPEGTHFEFPLSTLHELYEACGFAVAKDELRQALTGINWEINNNETRMVSTDGSRLAFAARRGSYPCKLRAILPPKLFALLPRAGETISISADPTHLSFRTDNTFIFCPQIAGPYPDYERVLPKRYPARAVLVRDEFIA